MGGAAAGPKTPLEQAAADLGIGDHLTAALTQQGLSRADALAALVMQEGDVEEALMAAATYMDMGGAAKVWDDMQPVQVVDLLQQAEVRERGREGHTDGCRTCYAWGTRRAVQTWLCDGSLV